MGLATSDVVVYRVASHSIVQDDELTRFELDIFSLIRKHPRVRLAVDFSKTFHVSSRALGLLVAFRKEINEAGGRIVLFGINPAIGKVMEVTRLDTLIPIFPDEGDARQSLIAE